MEQRESRTEEYPTAFLKDPQIEEDLSVSPSASEKFLKSVYADQTEETIFVFDQLQLGSVVELSDDISESDETSTSSNVSIVLEETDARYQKERDECEELEAANIEKNGNENEKSEQEEIRDETEVEKVEEESEQIGEREEPMSSISAAAEKLVKEETHEVESDYGFVADLPVEVLQDRQAMIDRLRELMCVQTELKRKNRLLEFWVARHNHKIRQGKYPPGLQLIKNLEDLDTLYRTTLFNYEKESSEILSRQNQIKDDLENYRTRVQEVIEYDQRSFDDLMNHERELGIDLVFRKTGRKLNEKNVDKLIRHQVLRRKLLSQCRLKYIFCRHRFEQVNAELRILETLGPGMTTLDYEVLHADNIYYKEKLDERDCDLEKMRLKIEGLINAVAHHREKSIALDEDIDNEKVEFAKYQEYFKVEREVVNHAHLLLSKVRFICNERKKEIESLMAQMKLREIKKIAEAFQDSAKVNVKVGKGKIQQKSRFDRNERQNQDGIAMTPMMRYESTLKAGRC